MNNTNAIERRIAENLQQIESQMRNACVRAGRNTNEVRLVAVTKYAKIEWVQALVALGVTHLGESRPQQLIERAALLNDSIQWHLIGHLQRNKVRPLLPINSLIHSVDSIRLLRRINGIAEADEGMRVRPQVLLEVNISEEDSKDGFSQQELLLQFDQFDELLNIEITGFMAMAPRVNHPEEARPVFTQLRELRNVINNNSTGEQYLQELSMGMSNDFEVAIEEGATIVRVGSKLYEGLT